MTYLDTAPSSSTPLQHGRVKTALPTFGFVEDTASGALFFVLPTAIMPRGVAWMSFRVDDPVTFQGYEHEKGLRAFNVRRVEVENEGGV